METERAFLHPSTQGQGSPVQVRGRGRAPAAPHSDRPHILGCAMIWGRKPASSSMREHNVCSLSSAQGLLLFLDQASSTPSSGGEHARAAIFIRQPAVVHLAPASRHRWQPDHIASRPQKCLHRLQAYVTQFVPRQRGLGSKKSPSPHGKTWMASTIGCRSNNLPPTATYICVATLPGIPERDPAPLTMMKAWMLGLPHEAERLGVRHISSAEALRWENYPPR